MTTFTYGRMRLGPSTTLVLDSGSRVRDYKCIRSSIWETLAKSGRLTHPQVTNHSLNFSNFSPTAHVATVFAAAVFQILPCTRVLELPDIAIIREFQLHFEKRDRIWAVLRNWQVNPRPRCGYLWIDWMKVSFGTVDPKRVKANMENSVLTKKLSLSGGPSICP